MTADLTPFLDLTNQDAQRQWRRISSRQPRPRQEKYQPVEVLLCYGLFFVLNPHRFGGANIEQVPEAVHILGRTFKRSPGSITSKMLNLNGSRPNSGRLEPDLFIRLASNPDQYLVLYLRILQAARDVGLENDLVPDFLKVYHMPDHTHAILLWGQEELGTEEIDLVVTENEEYIHDQTQQWGLGQEATTRLVIQKARIGQHSFARDVLANYSNACGFCGFAPGLALEGNRLLSASHIKPWRDSSHRERLDPRNGIAACPVHDAAFDGGLLTVNGGLRIHRAEVLQHRVSEDDRVAQFLGEEGLQGRLVLPQGSTAPGKKYLRYHQAHIFQQEAP